MVVAVLVAAIDIVPWRSRWSVQCRARARCGLLGRDRQGGWCRTGDRQGGPHDGDGRVGRPVGDGPGLIVLGAVHVAEVVTVESVQK
jgi:hypothetical protein